MPRHTVTTPAPTPRCPDTAVALPRGQHCPCSAVELIKDSYRHDMTTICGVHTETRTENPHRRIEDVMDVAAPGFIRGAGGSGPGRVGDWVKDPTPPGSGFLVRCHYRWVRVHQRRRTRRLLCREGARQPWEPRFIAVN